MFYIIYYENEDISILETHVSKNLLETKLRSIILDFFKSKNINLDYEELFDESDNFYLVNNENGSVSLYQKTTDIGYIYNAVKTREVRVYYIKSFENSNKPKMIGDLFNQQKSKLKKTVLIPQKKDEFNIMSELINNPKFLKLRESTNNEH
jgi:hypothetical protein